MNKHNKITALERDQIAWWLACGITIREMARRLGRSPSSISEELKRNKDDGVYGSIKAHQAAQARKRNSHQKYLLPHCPGLRDFVLEKLQLGWSPQQISGRLKKEIKEGVRPKKEYINHESIYQFLYDPAQQDQKLWEYLPRRHRKRRRWLGRRSRSVKIPNRVSIRHRAAEVDHRRDFGHWEGDTIVGDRHKAGIHTEVERVSRLVFAYKVPKIRAKETSVVQLFLFSRLPKLARKSTTLDNGSEHYLHTRLQEELGMQTYFADPYCSWQRGTNESTNGLIRRYFPKRTDFQLVSQEAVDEVVIRLNSTPRKVLGYQTPSEVFTAHLMQVMQGVRIET
jgi:IS30 family transposase